MIKYKLTTQDLKTHNGFQWEVGKTYTIETHGTEMCSGDVFHGYHSPEQAILFNPIHANIEPPRLWEVEIDAICADDGLKFGCKQMTLVRELLLPEFTVEERVAFAIYCAEPFASNSWKKWAAKWMSGEDRTAAAAWAAASWAAKASAWAEEAAAVWATAKAAEAAAKAAAKEAAKAAKAAARAAEAAAWAAAWSVRKIDFQETILRVRRA